ncbi:putative uncharacterized protein [Roseburia sp. CAG:309]|nr:putative uncharacterized protein [Roseburia sp. CAG:309]
MFSLSVQNAAGKLLELTHNENYNVTKVTGLNPPSATINTKTVTNFDGARFNSSRVNMRNIVITLLPVDPIDANRIALYEYFKVKQFVRIYYKNRLRDVYIDGYVETIEDDFFTMSQNIQISIICPETYFKSVDYGISRFLTVVDLFEAPFSIPEEGMAVSEKLNNYSVNVTNRGDVSTGMILYGVFTGNVSGLTIWNQLTKSRMAIDYQFKAGDELYINTNKGNKSITLLRSGAKSNLINYLKDESIWLVLEPGINSFEYVTEYGQMNVELSIEHADLYQGV